MKSIWLLKTTFWLNGKQSCCYHIYMRYSKKFSSLELDFNFLNTWPSSKINLKTQSEKFLKFTWNTWFEKQLRLFKNLCVRLCNISKTKISKQLKVLRKISSKEKTKKTAAHYLTKISFSESLFAWSIYFYFFYLGFVL